MAMKGRRRNDPFRFKDFPAIAGVLLLLIGSLGIYSVIWLESQPLSLPDMGGKALLSGTIFDADGPISNAKVTIIGGSDASRPSNRSDEMGKYTIRHIEAGERTIEVSHEGHRTIHVKALLYSSRYKEENRLDIRLTPSFEIHHNELDDASLYGNVTAINGTPLDNVSVTIPATSINTTTDGNGSFGLNNITPGRYLISASLSGFTNLSQEVVLLPNGTQLNFTLEMGNGTETRPLLTHHLVSGTVKDEKGRPMDRVQLIFHGTNTTSRPMVSDSFGLQVGTDIYDIWAYRDGFATEVFSNVIVNGSLSVDFTLEKQMPMERDGIEYFGYHYCALLQGLLACFALIGGALSIKRLHLNLTLFGCFCGLISIGPNWAFSSILSVAALVFIILGRHHFKRERPL